jgi:hypothetical protein
MSLSAGSLPAMKTSRGGVGLKTANNEIVICLAIFSFDLMQPEYLISPTCGRLKSPLFFNSISGERIPGKSDPLTERKTWSQRNNRPIIEIPGCED